MGSAEYEFGSTTRSRCTLAKLLKEGQIKAEVIKVRDYSMNGEYLSVMLIASEKFIEEIKNNLTKEDIRNKDWTNFHDPEKTVAWLHVNCHGDMSNKFAPEGDAYMLIREEMAEKLQPLVTHFLSIPYDEVE